MRDVHVVTCFLLRRGEEGANEVLLLRRSERVGTYRGLWAGVSGYLEAKSQLEQAYREMEEEVGLRSEDLRLLAEGEPLVVPDERVDTRWTVHSLEEMGCLKTVPRLAEALARVYGRR
jgi:ADP-ribose pyrophosphatase YjhB (NUDIX family)